MPVLELVFRVAASTEFLLVALFLVLQPGRKSAYRAAALFLLAVSSYLLVPILFYNWLWGIWAYPLLLLAILVPAFFYLFMAELFVQRQLPGLWLWLLILLTGAAGLLGFVAQHDGSNLANSHYYLWLAQLLKLIWGAAGLMIAVRDWRTDLVEPRRRLRRLLCVGAGIYILAVLVVELFIEQRAQDWMEMINVSLILCFATAFCIHFFSAGADNFIARIESGSGVESLWATSPPSELAEKVQRLLRDERFYARDEVTVSTLAAASSSQEHQLRRVINGELGYRNFNTFINRYRIEEVAARLQQPKFQSIPIITLALDAGFRSLAPFNRAFKEHFSLTPDEFRAQNR